MKLSDLYLSLDRHGRQALAHKAGVNAGYLWQIATKWRGKKPSIDVIARLVRADHRLEAADLIAEFSELSTAEHPMPNTPDPNQEPIPDRRIPIGPINVITKGRAHV